MGLRSASVRHSQVVMAPALTETTQSQNFKLAPKDHFQLATPINNFELNATYRLGKHDEFYEDEDENVEKKSGKSNGGTVIVAEKHGRCDFDDSDDAKTIINKTKKSVNRETASDNHFFATGDAGGNIMNSDREDNRMGLQKLGLESLTTTTTSTISNNREKTTTPNDVETLLLLNNLNAATSTGAGGEIPANVDELMRAITSSMEGAAGGGNVVKTLNDDEEDFPGISAGDLATSILSFEKQLLNDVDNMMNISIEDQQETEAENSESLKESRSKELISDAQKKQVEVQRRLDFLRRRVLKIQARAMGQHASGEIAGVFEHVHRSLKRLKETTVQESSVGVVASSTSGTSLLPLPSLLNSNASSNNDNSGGVSGDNNNKTYKPLSRSSAKTLVRKLETSTAIQANSAARQRQVPRYFGSGSIEPATFRTSVSGLVAIPPWTPEHKQELQKVSGALKSELRFVQAELDSEATDSSSGGESCDEFQNYNNQHQQYLSIQKRALWKYSTDRAAIAARWTWLQVQISDLEYRIRQHSELHRQQRASKGAVVLGGVAAPPSSPQPVSPAALNGYRGQLPGATTTTTQQHHQNQESVDDFSGDKTDERFHYDCARGRPLAGGFRKRKLLQTGGLHVISKRAARPASARCSCAAPAAHCALCTGRVDATRPRDPPETLSVREKVAAIDPGFHPVFSMQEDVSESVHLDAIMKMPEWQQRSARMKNLKGYAKGERLDKTLLDHRSKKLEHRKKYGRLLKPGTISALSAKIKNKIRGRKSGRHPGRSGGGGGRRHRHASSSSRRRSSHDDAGGGGASMEDDYDDLDSSHNHHHNAARSAGGSPASSPLLHMQSISGLGRKGSRVSSYDIDNIVIPYSVAASTRVEKLQYKEILTPKWRIADEAIETTAASTTVKSDVKDTKNNGAIKETEEDSEIEDLSEEATVSRHDTCEQEERKKFLSYLKFPLGHAPRPSASNNNSRLHKRTDSRAESSDANTPDHPLSPHSAENNNNNNTNSQQQQTESQKINNDINRAEEEGSREAEEAEPNRDTPVVAGDGTRGAEPDNATPPVNAVVVRETEKEAPLPSISVLRRRQMSSGRASKFDETTTTSTSSSADDQGQQQQQPEVQPYERRRFPLDEDECYSMLKEMPEDHRELRTNVHAQDTPHHLQQQNRSSLTANTATTTSSSHYDYDDDLVGGGGGCGARSSSSYLDSKVCSPGGCSSESTESAPNDEDPNDPEWIDVEKNNRERNHHKR